MSNDSDELRKDAEGSAAARDSANTKKRWTLRALWKAFKETFEEYLRMTKVGPFLRLFREVFGLTGILLLLAGFVAAVGVAYAGLLPAWLICRARPCGEYEMVANPNAVMAKALEDAEYGIEASGVALTFIDPHVLEKKIESGFSADLILLDPCSDAVFRRDEDTGHVSGARYNILNQLRRLKAQRELLPRDKKGLLHVSLSRRPATMAVVMFDRRLILYSYLCRYGANCTESPVIVFKRYGDGGTKNAFGFFFEQHYDAVSRDAGQPLDLDSYDPDNPCPASGDAARR